MSFPKSTPMIKQYLSIKEQYPDTILFYRMGDFYEMFVKVRSQDKSGLDGLMCMSKNSILDLLNEFAQTFRFQAPSNYESPNLPWNQLADIKENAIPPGDRLSVKAWIEEMPTLHKARRGDIAIAGLKN